MLWGHARFCVAYGVAGMIAVEYRVTVDRRSEWELAVEAWRRDEVRERVVAQSAETVAGRRADFTPTPLTSRQK